MNKTILFGVLLIIAAAIVNASGFNVSATAVNDHINIDESAQFVINLVNNLGESQEIKIYSPDLNWNLEQQTVTLYPNSKSSTKITIAPSKYVEPGLSGIKVILKNINTGEIVEHILLVNVKQPAESVSTYLPSVTMDVEVPGNIDPRDPLTLTAVLENQNTLDLPDLRLVVTSNLDELNTEQNVTLGSVTGKEGKKAIELNYNLNPLSEPGEHKVTFTVFNGKEEIEKQGPFNFKITGITPDYKEDINVKKSFLSSKTTIIYTSESNVRDVQIKEFKSGLLRRLFTSLEPEGYYENGYYKIDIELEPGESQTIEVTESYWIPFMVLLIAIAAFLINLKYKSPLKIKKGLAEVKMKEGGVSDIKVMVQLSNTGKKTIKNVSVTDYVPSIADLQKEFIEGTLRPNKILMHNQKGTVMKWELDELSPGEDRLISYSIKSKLSIIGNFRLPRAKIIFKRKGKDVHVYSNSIGVNA